MRPERMSDHLAAECDHAFRVCQGEARLLGDLDPVPGCSCVRCILLALLARGVIDAGDVDVLLHIALPELAAKIPAERPALAERFRRRWSRPGADLPSPTLLCRLAAKMPGARKAPRPVMHDKDPLPIEAARGADILTVCDALGIKLRRTGRSWRGDCPFHDSASGTSFSVDPSKAVYHCFGCGAGGDVIDLHQRVTGNEFADSVRELAQVKGALPCAV